MHLGRFPEPGLSLPAAHRLPHNEVTLLHGSHFSRRWLAAAVCLAVWMGVCALALPAQSRPAASADAALARAHAMHEALDRTPMAARRPADYQAIVAVLAPLWRNPRAPEADSARYEAASLDVDMARDLGDRQGFVLAARQFLALLHDSPYTSYRRNADFALAQIQIFHLNERRAAIYWLRDFLRRYPADPRAPVARLELIGRRVPEPAYLVSVEGPLGEVAAPPPLPGAAGVRPPPAASPAPPPVRAARARRLAVNIGNIRGVQVFTSAGASSVVISLRRQVRFTRGAIPRDRLVFFDISNRGAPRGRDSGDARLAVNDGRVASIRIAYNRPGFTRLVIVLASPRQRADRGRFFPNPDRLVIGIRGPAVAATLPPAPILLPARPAAPLAGGGDSLTRALGLGIRRVVIDPGHGGYDTGTIAPDGLEEKNIVLDVALRLGRLLRAAGVQVVYTRDDDRFIPLEQRTAIANRAHADLFVSIHANSSPDPHARGIETYYLNLTHDAQALAVAARENAGSGRSIFDLTSMVRAIAMNDKMEESHELADDLQRSLVAASGEPNRGVKTAPFVVLIGARMPSVLAEISFLSNRRDDLRLRQPAYRQHLAEGLFRGLRRYIHSLARPAAELASAGRPR
jgi:N-acetylmuramoyl-L-alanine amidase